MPFIPLDADEIGVGQPVLADTMTQVKDNFDSHESRITSLEGGGNTVYPPIIFRVNGNVTNITLSDTTLLTTMNFNLTVTGIFLLMETAGSAGTMEVDMQYKRGAGAWTSLLTTKPSLAYTAGNFALSSNAVLNLSEVNLQAGDLLRLVTTSRQTNGRSFLVRVDYNKT